MSLLRYYVIPQIDRSTAERLSTDLHESDGGLVPVGREGDAFHVLHLGGVGEHEGGLLGGGKAVDLGAANAVMNGGCA